MLQLASIAIADIAAAWRGRRVALAFAAEDLQDVYRRTWLGPVWMLLSYLLFVLSIVLIAGHGAMPNYLAFVAIGLLVFNYIAEVLGESTTLFRKEQNYIKGTTLPIFSYVARSTFRTLLREAFPLVCAIVLVIYSGILPTFAWGYALLGVLLLVVTAPAVTTVFAIIGMIVPDMTFIMANAIRLGLFLSPVFWDHGGDPFRRFFFVWNPLTHYITIVRSPILTGDPAFTSWLVAIGLSVCFWILAIFLLGTYRNRIVFMV